ncbi:MAG: hypothetical protein ACRDLB_16835 [Actinomycetota bacterium]
MLGGCAVGGSVDRVRPTAAVDTGESTARGYRETKLTGHIQDPQITESSGLVAASAGRGSYWTHNDSGGGVELYCLRSRGASCGTWTVTGAEAADWEDIAKGPGATAGATYLYLGDIGDNEAVRASISIYAVPEPSPTGADGATQPSTVLSFTYPDGPRDAETLLVHPSTGDLYVVSKGARPEVYAARAPLTSGTLEFVGLAPGPGPAPGPTGGDISPNGRRVIFSTYTGGIELRLPKGKTFDSIWARPPHAVSFPFDQREAIAYSPSGSSLLSTSEGKNAPIYKATRR